MAEDESTYRKLLKQGTITQEQYDSLVFTKITVGLGYNDIAEAIKGDPELKLDNVTVLPRTTDKMPYLYTDANEQYVVAKSSKKIVPSGSKSLLMYEDDIPVYDDKSVTSGIVYKLKRIEIPSTQTPVTGL